MSINNKFACTNQIWYNICIVDNNRLPTSIFTRYMGPIATLLTQQMQLLVPTYYLTSILLPIVLGLHYWHLASSVLLKGLWITSVAAAVWVSWGFADNICSMNSIFDFCVALLPRLAISTFMMWKVFGFNLLSVALPYGVVAVVLIAIKFWIGRNTDKELAKDDIAKYNGIFHIFSLGFVTLSIFPVCVIKILRWTIPSSKLAKGILLSITIVCSLVLACNVVASLWMFGRGVVVDDGSTNNLLSKLEHLWYVKPNDNLV